MDSDFPKPGTSQGTKDHLNESIELAFKTEKEEIENLKLEVGDKKPDIEVDDRDPTISFYCESCGMKEMCHYEGTTPPFSTTVTLSESSFIMRDPFQPFPPRGKSKAEYFLVLGACCCICAKVVCKDIQCSVFYARTFCVKCAKENLKKLPLEVQTKFRKQFL